MSTFPPMLFSQRQRYQRLPRWWKPVHRVLWGVRCRLPLNVVTDRAWRAYLRVLPSVPR